MQKSGRSSTELLTSGRLNAYLVELNKEAEDGMKWVRAMNNIRNRAAEVVYNDLIYC